MVVEKLVDDLFLPFKDGSGCRTSIFKHLDKESKFNPRWVV